MSAQFISVVLCDALGPLDNGVILYGADIIEPYNFGTDATHECLDGFDLEGDSVRVCISDGYGTTNGTWSNSQPSCSRKLIFSVSYYRVTVIINVKQLSPRLPLCI